MHTEAIGLKKAQKLTDGDKLALGGALLAAIMAFLSVRRYALKLL